MAIRAALIFNNHGKPRMTRFYSQVPTSKQQALLQKTFALVHRRTTHGTTSQGREVCNFLDAPELRPLLPPPATTPASARGAQDADDRSPAAESSLQAASRRSRDASLDERRRARHDDPLRVIYRHYATLYFVFIVDESESELGILDLIQVFVEALDRSFENVCELDLIFHFDEVYAILNEVIQGGLVLETNINDIAASTNAVLSARKQSAAQASAGGSAGTTTGSRALNGSGVSWTPPVGLGGIPWDAVSNVGGWARNVGSRFGTPNTGLR